MRTSLRHVVWALSLSLGMSGMVGMVGCGSDEPAATGDTGPIEEPCAHYASARCATLHRCASALFALDYGTTTSCEQRLAAWCVYVGGLPGVKLGPRAIGSCASTFSDMSCASWQSRRDDPLCDAPAGSLAAGKGCVNGYQCATKACFLDADGLCGTCQPTPTAGEGCRLSMECPSETSCIGYKCVTAAGVGEPCDSSKPCAGTLLCSGGTCAMSPNEGEPCVDGICNNKLATRCESGTCQGLTLAQDGEACGGTVYCAGGGSCMSQGTCRAPVPEEHPCDPHAGPACLEPGVCVDGWCKIPDASSCH